MNENTTEKENTEKTIKESQKVFSTFRKIGTVILILTIAAIVWSAAHNKRKQNPPKAECVSKSPRPQQWKLCWEKKPGHVGKTAQRKECVYGSIRKRTKQELIIFYSYPGGKGVIECYSTDGSAYKGTWKDNHGQGQQYLRFVSPTTAFGWADNNRQGEKIPNVLTVVN